MNDVNAILTIAYRDLLKLMRDRARLISSLVFPFVFIGVLGPSFQGSFGKMASFNLIIFTFTGVYAQTLFQSAAFGIISLIEDRDNDFSQEIFVSPISRYSIIFGKILGESLVAMVQGLAIIVFGVVLAVAAGIQVSLGSLLMMIPVGIVICLFGGAFGVIILGNLPSRRTAEQIFPFILLPQYFLSGMFTPIKDLPPVVSFLSIISPMRYAVDFVRNAFYVGSAEYNQTVIATPYFNIAVIGILFAVFLVSGTVLFVRAERNR
ncbi:MAG TPA: ABC transporter permease [Aggregatilineales bacterium]|nr:ABC transporter permease [Aggregatilineales bacterium]